jgi:hypothetical protein
MEYGNSGPGLRRESLSRSSHSKRQNPLLSRGFIWSGRRDSNPRPSPWQGDALPAELRPRQTGTIAQGRPFGAAAASTPGSAAQFNP